VEDTAIALMFSRSSEDYQHRTNEEWSKLLQEEDDPLEAAKLVLDWIDDKAQAGERQRGYEEEASVPGMATNEPIKLSRGNENSMQQKRIAAQEKPDKKSMLDIIADGLNKLKPGEWLENCRKADAEEDLALGRSAPDQPQVKASLQPIFPPNTAHADRPPLSKEEQMQRVEVLEKLLDLEELKKDIEVHRKGLLERLNQVPRRN
jgi:hypothetical protein